MRIPTHPLMRPWRAVLLGSALLLGTGCETTDASDLTGAALEAVDANAAATDDPVGPKGPFAAKMKQLHEILGPLPEECKPPAKPELADGDAADGPPDGKMGPPKGDKQGPPQGPPPTDGEDMAKGKPPIDGEQDAKGAKKGPPPGAHFAMIACALPEEQELIDAAAEACKPPHPPKAEGDCPEGEMGPPQGDKQGPPPQGGQKGPPPQGGQKGPPPQDGQAGGQAGGQGMGSDSAPDDADKPTEAELEAKKAACEAALDALIEAAADWKAITPQD